VVGLGGIGERAAALALPFDMRVKALRRSLRPADTPGVEVVGTLAEALDGADHVLIAAPLTDDTRHLINAESIAWMKPGVHIVNIARGGLIDQEALRSALDSGHVARASLDTVEPEPLPDGHWLYSHPAVRLSPHISWSMPHAQGLLIDTFRENLRRYLDGRALAYVVDVQLGY
jgi:phosphoglycerate dehydrogenase-like enzyme